MFVPFESLPAASRVWIFQASRPFSPEEILILQQRLFAFTEEWSVHGSPLNTSFIIEFDQFIVLGADETRQTASGCSIDGSVRTLKSMEQSFGVQFFNRNLVGFKSGEKVDLVALPELKQKFQEGILNEDTVTFNNLVSTKAEFETRWLVPAGETWLRRYIPDPLAKVK